MVEICDPLGGSRDAELSAPVARRELGFDHLGAKSGAPGGCIDDAFRHQWALLVVAERPNVENQAPD